MKFCWGQAAAAGLHQRALGHTNTLLQELLHVTTVSTPGTGQVRPLCALVTVFRSLHAITGAALHWAAPVSPLSRQSSSSTAVAAGRAELPATSVTQPHYSYTAPADHRLHEYNIPATSRQSTRRTYMLMEING